MKTNIVKALVKMTCFPGTDILKTYKENGRAQTDNEAVYEYIKDCFCDTVREKSEERRFAKINATLENFGAEPLFRIQDGDDVYVNIINTSDENIHLSEPLKTSDTAIYITVVLSGEGIKNIYMVYGCDFALYETGTDIKNPGQTIKELYGHDLSGKYGIFLLINNEKYSLIHMQNRLEAETLAKMGRGLTLSEITLKNGKSAKLYITDIS